MSTKDKKTTGMDIDPELAKVRNGLIYKIIKKIERKHRPEIEDILLKWLHSHEPRKVINALGIVGGERAWKILMKIVVEGDDNLHSAALAALSKSKSNAVKEEMISRFERFPIELRCRIFRCLTVGWPKNAASRKIAAQILQEEKPHREMLQVCLETLKYTGTHDELALEKLCVVPEFIEIAAQALVEIGDERAQELLKQIPNYRSKMSPEIMLRLVSALETVDHPSVSRIFKEAVKELDGKDYLTQLTEVSLCRTQNAAFLEDLIVTYSSDESLHSLLNEVVSHIIDCSNNPEELAAELSRKLTATLWGLVNRAKIDRGQIPSLSSPESRVVCQALDYLLQSGEPRLVEEVKEALKPDVDRIPQKLYEAMRIALHQSDPLQIAGMKALVEIFQSDDSRLKSLMRRIVKSMKFAEPQIKHIVAVGTPFAVVSPSSKVSKVLLDAFEILWPNRNKTVKSLRVLLQGLASMTDNNIYKAIQNILDAGFTPLMDTAVACLGSRGDAEALAMLRRMLRDKDMRKTKLWMLTVLSAVDEANPVDNPGIVKELMDLLASKPGEMLESRTIGLVTKYAPLEFLSFLQKYCHPGMPPRIQANAYEGLLQGYARCSKKFDSELIDFTYGILKDSPENYRIRAMAALYLMDAGEEAGLEIVEEMIKAGGAEALAVLALIRSEQVSALTQPICELAACTENPDILAALEKLLVYSDNADTEKADITQLREMTLLSLLGLQKAEDAKKSRVCSDGSGESYEELIKMRKEHTNLKRKAEFEMARKFEKELTVFFTDISGYTERSSKSDISDIMAMLNDYDQICLPHIEAFNGRLIKKIGDAFMVTFENPTDAVKAAIEVQKGVSDYNIIQPEEKRLKIRVGINTGPVMEKDGDVFGQTVNLASRVEGLCEPGDVYFTASTRAGLDKNIAVEEIGYRKVKGESEPLQIFRAIW